MFDAGDYKQRNVGRYKQGDVFVDTCSVSDGKQPYETAVAHPGYNEGKIVIVEAYPDRDSAQTGHEAWVKTMTSLPLPVKLTDCGNSFISQLAKAAGCKMSFPFKETA